MPDNTKPFHADQEGPPPWDVDPAPAPKPACTVTTDKVKCKRCPNWTTFLSSAVPLRKHLGICCDCFFRGAEVTERCLGCRKPTVFKNEADKHKKKRKCYDCRVHAAKLRAIDRETARVFSGRPYRKCSWSGKREYL